jgi:hypothetical protein
VKLVPVPSEDPPLEAANQFSVPAEAADSVTEPLPQLAPGVVEVTVGIGEIVATTAVLADAHPLLDASA